MYVCHMFVLRTARYLLTDFAIYKRFGQGVLILHCSVLSNQMIR